MRSAQDSPKDEALILGKPDPDGTSWSPIANSTTFPLTSPGHTSSAFQREGYSLHNCPLVCWRVRKVPDSFKNVTKPAGNVHYVCVSLLVTTDAILQYPEPIKLAGAAIVSFSLSCRLVSIL